MTEGAKNWFVESWSGVNITVVLGLVGGCVWTVAYGVSTQGYLIERVAILEDQLDATRATDIKLETMRITIENLTNYTGRLETQIVNVQEMNRDNASKIRDLERDAPR